MQISHWVKLTHRLFRTNFALPTSRILFTIYNLPRTAAWPVSRNQSLIQTNADIGCKQASPPLKRELSTDSQQYNRPSFKVEWLVLRHFRLHFRMKKSRESVIVVNMHIYDEAAACSVSRSDATLSAISAARLCISLYFLLC